MKIKNTQKLNNSQSKNNDIETYSKKNGLVKKEVLAVKITTASKVEVLEYIMHTIRNSSKNYYIVTPNPEMMVYASTHSDFRTILNNAELALCDGVGLFWGAKVLGEPLQERFTGVELLEKLCEKANKQPITIGFFGGKLGVAEIASECLLKKYPYLNIVYVSDGRSEGYPESNSRKTFKKSIFHDGNGQDTKVTTRGQSKNKMPSVDILFVALGFPKQEQWMAEHINKIPVRVMVGVGGALDFISGKVPRAPIWVQNVGLEWLFRLLLQPWRIKRQLALPQFVWMVLREKL